MEFKVNTQEFEKVLNQVVSIIPARSPMPILDHFLLSIKDNMLSVYATDMQIALQTSIPVTSAQETSIAVPAKLLHDTIKSLTDTDVKISTDKDQKIKITTDTGVFKISYLESADFPHLPAFQEIYNFSISTDRLKRALDTTNSAISKEEARISMTGVLMELKSDELRFVATDAHRLVKLSYMDFQNTIEKKIIIPGRAVQVVSKMLSDSDVRVSFNDSQIRLEQGSIVFVSRLIEDQYPNYESVIPLENDNLLETSRDELTNVLRRISLFTSSQTKQVKFSISKDILSLSAENIDLGSEANEKILCDYQGAPMEIAFNSTYVSEAIRNINTERVIFKLNNPTRACILEPKTQVENENLLVLIMPMRLNT
ncbi:MAG: DNA polymerase III subunit beta [Ignavibacteria bacterium]|nr:DNA polymerase III subunit beta [Ignavibacteria bacterium]